MNLTAHGKGTLRRFVVGVVFTIVVFVALVRMEATS